MGSGGDRDRVNATEEAMTVSCTEDDTGVLTSPKEAQGRICSQMYQQNGLERAGA